MPFSIFWHNVIIKSMPNCYAKTEKLAETKLNPLHPRSVTSENNFCSSPFSVSIRRLSLLVRRRLAVRSFSNLANTMPSVLYTSFVSMKLLLTVLDVMLFRCSSLGSVLKQVVLVVLYGGGKYLCNLLTFFSL